MLAETSDADECMPGVVVQEWRFDEQPRGSELVFYLKSVFPKTVSVETLDRLKNPTFEAKWVNDGVKRFDEVLRKKRDAFRKEGIASTFLTGSTKKPVTIKPTHETESIISPNWYTWGDPAAIPKREWLYGHHYIRKFVSATMAPGGVGKSSLVKAEAFAMATGTALLGIQPPKALSVWYFNLEDPIEELQRRFKAIELFYGIEADNPIFSNQNLAVHGRETELVVASQMKGEVVIVEPLLEALKEAIIRYRIDVVIIDPFVSSHRVSENDNNQVDIVVKKWAKLADEADCCVELVHHVRKTNGAEVTVEDGRGASALLAAVRSARVLNVMSQDEADKAGVTNRRSFFRVENGKSNMSRPGDASNWYEMVSQPLPNGTNGMLEDGDDVGVCSSWAWPQALDGFTVDDLRKAQSAVAKGNYRESIQAKEWAGHAIGTALGFDTRGNKSDRARIKQALQIWCNKGMFETLIRKDATGQDRPYLVVGECADD